MSRRASRMNRRVASGQGRRAVAFARRVWLAAPSHCVASSLPLFVSHLLSLEGAAVPNAAGRRTPSVHLALPARRRSVSRHALWGRRGRRFPPVHLCTRGMSAVPCATRLRSHRVERCLPPGFRCHPQSHGVLGSLAEDWSFLTIIEVIVSFFSHNPSVPGGLPVERRCARRLPPSRETTMDSTPFASRHGGRDVIRALTDACEQRRCLPTRPAR